MLLNVCFIVEVNLFRVVYVVLICWFMDSFFIFIQCIVDVDYVVCVRFGL